MIDITPKNLDLIAMRDKIVPDEDGFGASLGDLGGMNEQQVLDLLRNLKAGGGFLTGSMTTTDAVPQTFELIELPNNSNIIIEANVIAEDTSDSQYGTFIRNAHYKNVAGTVSLIDQIQDAFTMRDDSDWKVDFRTLNKKVYLRVWGEAAKTIKWSFKVLIVTTIT